MSSSGLKLASSLLLLLFIASPSYSHIEDGQLKIVDNFRVKFTISPDNPKPRDVISLLFSIQDLELRDVENLTIVSLRIIYEDNQVVYGVENLFKEKGDFAVDIQLPYEGKYAVILEFKTMNEANVIKVEFSFSIGAGGESSFHLILIPLLIAVLLGIVVARRKRRKT